MSLSSLTPDEATLHFYAALVQRDLDAYHTCVSGDKAHWNHIFESHLRRAMNYFEEVLREGKAPPHVHPLLLSLCEVWNASDVSQDIHSISDNDSRVIGGIYYVPPSEFLPLSAHFTQNDNNLGTGSHSAAGLKDISKGKQPVDTATLDIQDEVSALKRKLATYEHILEALRTQVLRISDHLNILDPSYEGEQYDYTFMDADVSISANIDADRAAKALEAMAKLPSVMRVADRVADAAADIDADRAAEVLEAMVKLPSVMRVANVAANAAADIDADRAAEVLEAMAKLPSVMRVADGAANAAADIDADRAAEALEAMAKLPSVMRVADVAAEAAADIDANRAAEAYESLGIVAEDHALAGGPPKEFHLAAFTVYL
ncbi:hypothetical protein EI94DRAFT_1801938 [Lactarius quietus]|nr:hypothetical protein EI94DRAFT_1801938 [Lactarius quietus]